MNRKRGSLPSHRRTPTLDCSPLRKSVAAFAAEEALVDSQQPPSGSAASTLRGSGGSGDGSLRGSDDSGDRIPAHRGPADCGSINAPGPAAAPQGSAWNPWQEHSVPPPPLPPRRVVAHRPSPSWFSPVLGFGGPASCVWEEEEQRRAQERQQAQQGRHAQQQQQQQPPQQPQQAQQGRHTQQQQQPPQPSQHHQHHHQQAQENERQPPTVQRSIPWYQQGWQQQPRQPQQPSPLQYPGGNPFVSEPGGVATTGAGVASCVPSPQPQQAGRSQLGSGCSSGRKLPPPPRFLLARSAQPPQHAEQALQAEQQTQVHQPLPMPAAMLPPVQQPGSTGQPCPPVLGRADVAADVHPGACEQQAVGSANGQAGIPAACSQQQPQPAGAPQAWTPLAPVLPAEAASATALPRPPPPPPPPPGRPAVQRGGAAPPPPPPPPPAGPAARPVGAPPPPPLPPRPAASGSAGRVLASSVPAPAPQAAATAAPAAAPQPPAAPPAPAAPAAGGSALSAIRSDELLAAAGRLRKVQPGADVEGSQGSVGSGSAAAGSRAAGGAAPQDPRAALLDQIKNGVKLRPVEARKLPPPAAPAAGPLGQATPSMAELLRKVVEARRVDAGGDSDSDSDWGA